MQTWHVYLHKKDIPNIPYSHRRLPLPWLLEHFSGPIIQLGSVQQGLWILPVCLLAISLGKYLLRSRYDIRIFHPQCYSYLRLYLEFKETQKNHATVSSFCFNYCKHEDHFGSKKLNTKKKQSLTRVQSGPALVCKADAPKVWQLAAGDLKEKKHSKNGEAWNHDRNPKTSAVFLLQVFYIAMFVDRLFKSCFFCFKRRKDVPTLYPGRFHSKIALWQWGLGGDKKDRLSFVWLGRLFFLDHS